MTHRSPSPECSVCKGGSSAFRVEVPPKADAASVRFAWSQGASTVKVAPRVLK
jgi:hypothetical protein